MNAAAVALAACVLAAGCSSPPEHWIATSTQPGTTVPPVRGLTRLVLLPPVYEIDGKIDGKWSTEGQNTLLRIDTVRYLVDWRGYRVELAGTAEQPTGPAIEELRTRLLAHQRAAPAQGRPLPEDLAADVRRIAAVHQVDGVAVLGVRFYGLDAARWGAVYGISFITMGVGQWFYLDTLGTYTDAAIYEGAAGALAWSARNKSGIWSAPLAPEDVGRFAFDALPTALPEALLRDRTPDRP